MLGLMPDAGDPQSSKARSLPPKAGQICLLPSLVSEFKPQPYCFLGVSGGKRGDKSCLEVCKGQDKCKAWGIRAAPL